MEPLVSCHVVTTIVQSNHNTLSLCFGTHTGIKKNNETYFCDCPIGFTGKKCERRRTCFSEDCNYDFAHCVNNKICACLPNPNGYYSKSHCDAINDCAMDNLCMNGGTCKSSHYGGYYCLCPEDYEGLICQKRVSWKAAEPKVQ